jgi:hypothetical protein
VQLVLYFYVDDIKILEFKTFGWIRVNFSSKNRVLRLDIIRQQTGH